MERQRMMMMTEAFVLPMLGLLLVIAGTYTYLKDPFADYYLAQCKAEEAELNEFYDVDSYVSREAAEDIWEVWPDRQLSEHCQSVFQNHQ